MLKQYIQLDCNTGNRSKTQQVQLTYLHQNDLICIVLFKNNYTDVELEDQAQKTHTHGDEVKKKV